MFINIISITVFGFVVVREFGLSESVECFPSSIFVYILYHKIVTNMIHKLRVFFSDKSLLLGGFHNCVLEIQHASL